MMPVAKSSVIGGMISGNHWILAKNLNQIVQMHGGIGDAVIQLLYELLLLDCKGIKT